MAQAIEARVSTDRRDAAIQQYAPLVKYVVGRLAIGLPAILDYEDILSYGTIGLIDALDRFDDSKGVKFETYAISRIRGAIIDNLRALGFVRYPVQHGWMHRRWRRHRHRVLCNRRPALLQFGQLPVDLEGQVFQSPRVIPGPVAPSSQNQNRCAKRRARERIAPRRIVEHGDVVHEHRQQHDAEEHD